MTAWCETDARAQQTAGLVGLMNLAARGDQRAFAELHILTVNKMRKTILAVSPASPDVEDMLQDAYVKIWRNAARFDPGKASPISWMSAIARNTAIDAARLKKLATTELDEGMSVPSPVDDAADGFDYARARPIAAEVIGRLPDDRRDLLSRAYLEGESRVALSQRFGVPVSTVKTWLRRTLQIVQAECLIQVGRTASDMGA